jgi:hypothetical protein
VSISAALANRAGGPLAHHAPADFGYSDACRQRCIAEWSDRVGWQRRNDF